MTDTLRLRSLLVANAVTTRQAAAYLGISLQAFLNKLNNETEFKSSEIKSLCELLHITDLAEKEAIFFKQKDECNSTLSV